MPQLFSQGASVLHMISKSGLPWHDAGGMPEQRVQLDDMHRAGLS
jgi:hypothetical protein